MVDELAWIREGFRVGHTTWLGFDIGGMYMYVYMYMKKCVYEKTYLKKQYEYVSTFVVMIF